MHGVCARCFHDGRPTLLPPHQINADDVEINVDTIDARTFWEVSAIVRASLKRKETGAGPSNGESSGGKSRKRARR